MSLRKKLGPRVGLQGNLDPAMLFGPAEKIREATLEILRRTWRRRAHFEFGARDFAAYAGGKREAVHRNRPASRIGGSQPAAR